MEFEETTEKKLKSLVLAVCELKFLELVLVRAKGLAARVLEDIDRRQPTNVVERDHESPPCEPTANEPWPVSKLQENSAVMIPFWKVVRVLVLPRASKCKAAQDNQEHQGRGGPT